MPGAGGRGAGALELRSGVGAAAAAPGLGAQLRAGRPVALQRVHSRGPRRRGVLLVTAGVRHLTRFLNENRAVAGEHLTLSELPLNAHGQRVLVADGASLAFFLLGPRRHGSDKAPLVSAWHLGGEYRDLAARTRRFAAGLRAAGVSLTCVFDPAPMTHPESMRKVATWAERLQKTTRAVGELAALAARGSCESAALDSTPPPELFLEQVKRSLVEAGANVVVSLAAEADDQLVALVREGLAYAVMSNDSDFAAAEGCRWMPLDLLEGRALMSGDADAAARARGWFFEPRAVAASLGLRSTMQLFQMACIVGQDATSELVDKFDIMTRLGVARVRDRSPVLQVSSWLLERTPTPQGRAAAGETADPLTFLEAQVPQLCGLAPEDAAAWAEAVRASRLLYLAPAPGGAALEDALAWLSALPPVSREVAAAVVRDALPAWALPIAVHRRGMLPGMSYERPWGSAAGGGVAAAHRPLRARMYALLLPDPGPPVREHAWSGEFWGSGGAEVAVPPDAAGAAAAVAAGDADAAAGHAWARLRALLHPVASVPLPLPPAASDPALALPSDEAFAALVLRYLLSLRLVSNATLVRRLSAWQAAACVATVAAALSAHEAAAAAGDAYGGAEMGPDRWDPPAWRCLELSTLLQTSISHALAAADVAGPRGSRRLAPAPAQLFSGFELLNMFRLAENDARFSTAEAADSRKWPPAWWAAALPPAAAARAARLAAAALHGLPPGILDNVAPEAAENSALDDLLLRFAAAGALPPARTEGEGGYQAAFDFGGADSDVLLPAEAPRRDAASDTSLPVEEHLPALLAASAKHAVLCVDGETGCGKSTMVPLALLRAAGSRGLVIVTQPRRVAAMSLARRVAHTMGEPLGESVGYAIGQERVASSRTRLLFVTTGWLLRLAASASARTGSAAFARATHVVLDEAHDRSLDADFLSLLIKRRLAATGRGCPKIVVMSATLQAGVFGAYFGSVASAAPVVHVGARRFPIKDVYLDELTSALGVTRPALLAAAAAEASDSAALIADMAAAKRSRRAPRASRRLLDIVVQLVLHTARPGATTLVFLPGSAEIEAAQLSMLAYGEGRAPIEVFPLHSLVPREMQAAALEPPSAGMARVLLSTDIAESSLTLPDVTVVIDACMRRGPAWSEEKQMTSMNTWYASRASLAQRAGRAGRVQPGTVVRLISRSAAELLPAHDAPEMECVSLDGVVLRAKHLLNSQAERVQELLAGAVSPPAPARVEASLLRLVECGALTSEVGTLTTLGAFAALLPQLPLTVARALLIGLSAGAGADAVVLAAALCLEAAPFKQVLAMFALSRTAFVEDTAAAMRVGAEADAGRFSEPITWCHIYRQYTTGVGVFPRPAWQRIRRQLGVRAMKAFATVVRSLARDVPRALAATGIQLSSRDLAAIARLGSNRDAAGSGTLRTFDPEAFAELELLDPDEDGYATPVETIPDARAVNEPLLRLLTVAACGPNLLKGRRRTPLSAGLEDAMKAQGAVWNRCLALFPPAWLRERGAAHLEASLTAAFGPNVVECVHELAEPGEDEASETGASAAALAEPKLSKVHKKKLQKRDAEAWVVQFAANPPGGDGLSGALEPPLLNNNMPVAAKCLIALGGGRRLIPLPVPSVATSEGLFGEPGRIVDGPTSRDEAAGRALSGWDLPHPLWWKWLHGEATSRGKLPMVDLAQPSALHGVSESQAAAASRMYDSGRRYAAAASLMVYEDSGIRARVLTLLPTRGVDAELMLLALSPGNMPPRARVRRVPNEPPGIVALAFTPPDVDEPFANLAPYCLRRQDLEVINALRAAFSATVLRSDVAALPAALGRFMDLGAAVLTRPMSIGFTLANVSDDATTLLAAAPDAQGPWPPYDLRLLDDA